MSIFLLKKLYAFIDAVPGCVLVKVFRGRAPVSLKFSKKFAKDFLGAICATSPARRPVNGAAPIFEARTALLKAFRAFLAFSAAASANFRAASRSAAFLAAAAAAFASAWARAASSAAFLAAALFAAFLAAALFAAFLAAASSAAAAALFAASSAAALFAAFLAAALFAALLLFEPPEGC